MAAVARQSDSAACALCAGQAFQPFRFGLLRCAGCGLVVDPAVFRPGAAEALNQDAFGDGYEAKPSFWSRWFEDWKNRRYLANLRRAEVTRGRLLEVGVGTGAFLRAARHAGFEVEGCDLSASLCRHVQQATGVAVHNVPLEQLPAGFYRVPFRYLALFLYHYVVQGAWRAGLVGYVWARLRADVMRIIEYKRRELELTGRLPAKRVYGPGRPDPRVQQFD